jgi:hypothetical protein
VNVRGSDGRIVLMMERTDPLGERPFTCAARADGSILIRYRSAPVTVLRGKAAERFATRLDGTDAAGAQQLMARVTGNFKRGTDRAGRGLGRPEPPVG